jgi:chromosomal replication initiation ATPase DnaA
MQPGNAARRHREGTPARVRRRKRDRTARDEERIFEACDSIVDLAAAFFNVPGRELRQPGRSTVDVTRVRQIAMYLAHVMLALPMRDVGKAFGKDRTTVVHACHLVEEMRDDAELDAVVCRLERVVAVALSGHRLYWRSGRFGE